MHVIRCFNHFNSNLRCLLRILYSCFQILQRIFHPLLLILKILTIPHKHQHVCVIPYKLYHFFVLFFKGNTNNSTVATQNQLPKKDPVRIIRISPEDNKYPSQINSRGGYRKRSFSFPSSSPIRKGTVPSSHHYSGHTYSKSTVESQLKRKLTLVKRRLDVLYRQCSNDCRDDYESHLDMMDFDDADSDRFSFLPFFSIHIFKRAKRRLERKELQHEMDVCLRRCRSDVDQRRDELCNDLKQDGLDLCDRQYDGFIYIYFTLFLYSFWFHQTFGR